ncbi:PX domain-containing protein 1 [Physeter macrocephalus]|uniref:PX domain-containing protein 1 n=1 Tax=Physeter macrocephalus TaxID=9755 RepID=A0A455AHR8_PHYMC|nr:PX domain-containing protein 1 [Physeter catodon]|eukprot:XP_028335338.1 PX domain-containing protein 1 [Physeter catodon]
MASAVFEGTSLVNMFVRGCWVNGIRRLIVSRRGDEEEFFEIRTEWSDRSVLYLHRSLADLGRLWQRLRDAFPEDRPELALAPLREGLVAIKDAHDIETRLNEVEKLLKAVISMPRKYSRSEVVLTFFERSPLDQVLKNDNVHKIQPSFQSPVKISGESHRATRNLPSPPSPCRTRLPALESRKTAQQEGGRSRGGTGTDFYETVCFYLPACSLHSSYFQSELSGI